MTAPRYLRWVVWTILLGLAAVQAWSARFLMTPDGVSYLDLSDAVVSGRIAGLVNAYWSPLYPTLIGAVRVVARPNAYWEFAWVHALNLVLFAASLAAFEYFLGAVDEASARMGRMSLQSTMGRIIAYALFGGLSLMMTPLTLPTPDLIVTAATFIAFAAMLRFRHQPTSARQAVILGVALAVGA